MIRCAGVTEIRVPIIPDNAGDGGNSSISVVPAIAYGNVATAGQFPFIVRLGYETSTYWATFCGGSLLWPNLVLTAGT